MPAPAAPAARAPRRLARQGKKCIEKRRALLAALATAHTLAPPGAPPKLILGARRAAPWWRWGCAGSAAGWRAGSRGGSTGAACARAGTAARSVTACSSCTKQRARISRQWQVAPRNLQLACRLQRRQRRARQEVPAAAPAPQRRSQSGTPGLGGLLARWAAHGERLRWWEKQRGLWAVWSVGSERVVAGAAARRCGRVRAGTADSTAAAHS